MMKILRYIIWIVLGMAASALPSTAQKNDWAEFRRYAEDNSRIKAMGDERPRIVLFGNSITDSWATMRPGFFKEKGLIGRGISGQTTYQFLSRFREDAVALQPSVIVLNGGTNDIAENTHPYDEEKTIGNIRSMVEIAGANGIRVILTSVLPAAGFKWNRSVTDAPDRIISLNRAIKAMAEEKGLDYIDYYSLLVDQADKSFKKELTLDGVHPNEKGYAVMEEALIPHLMLK
ncbi:MAG: SGNH/GDSL hydrolase family protein [Muribaculaceae bacterium]|nr:SGNH/GDSL hydrolase family protein [Muribaculaceae bacterium]